MDTSVIINGIVQKGRQRGKRLGFPTINFPLTAKIAEGIYASQTKIDDKDYHSLTFIGAAKTYGETIFQAETYLFDFDQDVYGKQATVSLLKKIRENQKFESEDALIAKMQEDKQKALDYFAK